MGEADLLPFVLQVHLVGEAELDVVDQLRALGRLGRLARLVVRPERAPAAGSSAIGDAVGPARRLSASAGSASSRGRCRPDRPSRPRFPAPGRPVAASSGVKRARSTCRRPRARLAGGRRHRRCPGMGVRRCASSCLTSRLWSSLETGCLFNDSACAGSSLPEELRLRRLRPADQLHAFVQVLHQRRQPHQELLAQRRRAFRLHAHHEVAADAPEALGTVRRRRRRAGPPAPAPGSRPAAGSCAGTAAASAARARLQLQHVALLHAQLDLLARRAC